MKAEKHNFQKQKWKMKNSEHKNFQESLERYLRFPLSSEINQHFLPKKYSISKEGSISLSFDLPLIKHSYFQSIEVVRFENSPNSCNINFTINLDKNHHEKIKFISVLVDLIVEFYGDDETGDGKFNSIDDTDLNGDYWIGRSWLDNKKYPIPIIISKMDPDNIQATFFL